MLDHERLDAYRRALVLLERCDSVLEQVPGMTTNLRDQLERASVSVVLNIAEGAGEFSPDEKRRFYRMARRSAIETAAILDVLELRRQAPEAQLTGARNELQSIVNMLVRLIKK